jgi:asparagine synthase (glutamine-hydrolysing)
MCGIAGFVTLRPGTPDPDVLRRMTESIRHRGPDAEGFYLDAHAALGHRRLSIVDLSTGAQPMTNEDGSLHVVFNGEIFNHADLRPKLKKCGHRYKTSSDTEAILHAYEEYGSECVTQFRGMFAFVIWDATRKRISGARDRLGIKPFYYFYDGRTLVFASEIKALLEHPAVSAEINEERLGEYLAFGYTSGEETLFRGIRKLMPGHRFTFDEEGLQIEQYWDVPRAERFEDRPDEDWIRECRRRLEETVRMRLMSDVPLGAFLSGGVDSSAITALMTRMVTGRVKTFSVGYEETRYSELGYASEVARTLGTEHREVRVSRSDFFGALPKLVWQEDEPICWPSSIPLYFVSKLAAEEVKVVLTGEGSDEIFGGYHRYAHYLRNQRLLGAYGRLPAGLRRGVRAIIASNPLLSGDVRRKLSHTILGRAETVESLHVDNFYSALSAEDQRGMLRTGNAEVYDNFLGYWQRGEQASTLGRLLYADQKTYLVELLMKQDQMSMASSIESRVPLLDHPLVEFAARVPDRMKIRDGVGKYIFKKAVEDLLPGEIVHRTKMGFPTPVRDWLRDEQAGEIRTQLLNGTGLLAEYVRREPLERLLDEHKEGRRDATDQIWRLLNLQVWGEVFFSGRSRRQGAMVGVEG